MKNTVGRMGFGEQSMQIAKVSAKGAFDLFCDLATSTIISAVDVIITVRLLSPSEYGLFAHLNIYNQ